jgi:glycosyltransferase involved in cell wall biosynthesis
MADQTSNQRIAAIVPAFDEERDIAGVLRELSSYEGFSEVIVVDDGSQDATAQVAASFPIHLIRHEHNKGKGRAMQTGVDATDADIIFFCDADMRGLSHALLDDVLAPVISGETDMVIAMRNWRMYYAKFILSIIPILGGQRAVRRALWEKVPHTYKERFMIETALNFYARYWGNGYQYKVVQGLKQTIKEKKYGYWRGMKARLKMSGEVLAAQVRLQFAAVPRDVRTGRVALANTFGALIGTLFGALFLLAAYYGPVVFVRELYADKMHADPDTPFIDLLFYLAANTSADVIAGIGLALVALNAFFAVLNLKNLRFLSYPLSPVRRI